MEIFASGNLAIDPVVRQGRHAPYHAFTMTSNVVNDDNEFEQEWIDCLVHGPLRARVKGLKKGDGVWARGNVTKHRYVQGNQEREVWVMRVNELITHNETWEA